MTGKLHDADTRKPLSDFTVKLLRVSWYRGRRRFTAQGVGSANEAGDFRIEAMPGDYFLEVWKAPAPNRILPGRQPDYSKTLPQPTDYPVTLWPPGDPDTAIPLTVRGGAELSLGNIDLSRIPLSRVRVTMPLSRCAGHQTVDVAFDRLPVFDPVTRGELRMPCGTDFTISNLSPGAYRFEIVAFDGAGGFATVGLASGPAGNTARVFNFEGPGPGASPPNLASAIVHIAEGSDLDLDPAFQPLADVKGKVECECADGWKDALRGARISLGPLGVVDAEATLTAVSAETLDRVPSPFETVDAQGTFRLVAGASGAVRVSLDPMPAGIAIKAGKTFTPDTGASAQSLTLQLTDRLAQLTGTVRRDGKPVAGAHIFFARWPLEMVDGFPENQTVETGSQGAFALDVAPGTYRAIVVNKADSARSEMPGILAIWLASGTEFTLAGRQTRALNVELKPPE